MAEQNQQHGRRPHFHRGRRGADRRGTDRRAPSREHAPEAATPRDTPRDGGVDVEQIMREIRSRIAQRHGIELSNPQIQELAARRLDAILEPRNIKPQLLEQLRKSAGAGPDIPTSPAIESFEFEETTLYDTHRGILRFIRNLLNPLLKLFFNPAPLITALNTQARINKELAAREAERERRQSEWNALQYELIQRAVLETSRVSIEMQALASRVESLSAKVDFNERRVRSMENVPSSSPQRQPPRQQEPVAMAAVPPVQAAPPDQPTGEGPGDGTRRRRRRRRGRRGGSGTVEPGAAVGAATGVEDEADVDMVEGDDDDVTVLEAESSPASDAAKPTDQRPAESVVAPAAPPVSQEPPMSPEPVAPSPPRDEPTPENPVDRADSGPVDR